MSKPETVSIIGLGRFGKLWASILLGDFRVVRVYDSRIEIAQSAVELGCQFVDLATALSSDVIFYCVPISAFEETIVAHSAVLAQAKSTKLLIDLLSVKVHPQQVFEKHLPENCNALLAHPMFGPDSVRLKGLAGQTLVINQFRANSDEFNFWNDYFRDKGLRVLEMSPDEHDELAAGSQGVTHFIGRVLQEFIFKETDIDTLGAKKLHEIEDQVCSDTWQLFVDLQTYNPYTRSMRVEISDAVNKVFDRLLPDRIDKDHLLIGIQGGHGSFNEEAARYYMSRTPDVPFELMYLHTTENVLQALHEGLVDRGQFAIHNSIGGIVNETVQATARHRFEIIEEFSIKISHALMIAKDADFDAVDTIMTHDQVLRQCRTNLEKKYSRLKQTTGEGDLIDHAKVAELLGRGELPKNVATMGSKVLAEINGLKIVEENLQDLESNFTSFLWVRRPG